MSYAAIGSPLRDPSSPYHAAAAEAAATTRKLENTTAKITNTAPKTDVIDLSGPPTQEQAERLRNFGILGYGSVSAAKTVTVQPLSGNTSLTHFAADYQKEYFDLVHHTTVRTSSTGAGVFSSGGSAFESTTSQLVQSWDNSNWTASVLYERGFTLKMGGLSEWYIPSHQNEDGSWSLAQFGPSPTSYISGYRSVLATAQHSDGQTELSLSETTVYKSVSIFPSQERPAGAVDYRNERLDQLITQELLDRIGKDIKPLPLRRFNIQA